jgi:hypothetical protein
MTSGSISDSRPDLKKLTKWHLNAQLLVKPEATGDSVNPAYSTVPPVAIADSFCQVPGYASRQREETLRSRTSECGVEDIHPIAQRIRPYEPVFERIPVSLGVVGYTRNNAGCNEFCHVLQLQGEGMEVRDVSLLSVERDTSIDSREQGAKVHRCVIPIGSAQRPRLTRGRSRFDGGRRVQPRVGLLWSP